ncbi:hypothetical protein Q7P37_006855 [Cladosporium fusiforme]
MTTRYPSSCLQAVSCLNRTQHASSPASITLHISLLRHQPAYSRHYSFSKNAPRKNGAKPPPIPQSTLTPTRERSINDPSDEVLNPPPSTRPPPLDLPTRGQEAYPIYLYRTGRAYGTFYKDGLKAVWGNHRAASALKKRVAVDINVRKPDLAPPVSASKRWSTFRNEAVHRGVLSRAEFQQLERNARDIAKLPFFGLLVVLLGEWLPLLVPFIPNRVPGTCRIPKQVQGMREKSEQRRQRSFRAGIEEPQAGQVAVEGGRWRMMNKENVREILKNLGPKQLEHLSCVLNQHSSVWDRLQLPPPAWLLRKSVCARVHYLALDDFLLVRAGGPAGLKREELAIACEERGIDVLGKPDERLRKELEAWMKKQADDEGRGWAVIEMLFRRPNAWIGANQN